MSDEDKTECETVKIGVAAELAGLSEQTLRNYAKRGIIDHKVNPINKYRQYWSNDAKALRAYTRDK